MKKLLLVLCMLLTTNTNAFAYCVPGEGSLWEYNNCLERERNRSEELEYQRQMVEIQRQQLQLQKQQLNQMNQNYQYNNGQLPNYGYWNWR